MHDFTVSTGNSGPSFLLGSASDGDDPFVLSEQTESSTLQDLINGLTDNAALIEPDGTIVAINRTWESSIRQLEAEGLQVGRDYMTYWRSEAEKGDESACRLVRAFRDVAAGRRKRAIRGYQNPGHFGGRHFKVVYSCSAIAGRPLVLASVYDITQLLSLKRKLRQLTSGILRAQEDERRRMARDLHDGTAQLITGLQLSLMRLRCANLDDGAVELIAECTDTLARMQREIRSLSFMFHPPALERHSLATALTQLFEGVGSRTGIEVQFRAGEIGVISASVESTLFRIAQEALANVHRHASATNVSAELIDGCDCIHLIIGDNGTGFDTESLKVTNVGVGIRGMRERVRELGGRLAFHQLNPGTALIVSLPREKPDVTDLERDPEPWQFGDPRDSQCA